MRVSRFMTAILATLALSACSVPVAHLDLAMATRRPQLARATSEASLGLRRDRIRLVVVDDHEVQLVGQAGAIRGAGAWVSPGNHTEPAEGYEAPARPDGAFTIEVHAHAGESITLWAYRDLPDGRRDYSQPLVLRVP